jgi:cellobiose phosphorylase
VPALTPYERYECHVGLGYYPHPFSVVNGIETITTIFVPNGEEREVRDIHITNRRDEPVELDAVPVVEYTHFDALEAVYECRLGSADDAVLGAAMAGKDHAHLMPVSLHAQRNKCKLLHIQSACLIIRIRPEVGF